MGRVFWAGGQKPQRKDSDSPECKSVPSALAAPFIFAVRQDEAQTLDWRYPTMHFATDAVEVIGLVKIEVLVQGELAAMPDVKLCIKLCTNSSERLLGYQ
jgi:hypothetical protein